MSGNSKEIMVKGKIGNNENIEKIKNNLSKSTYSKAYQSITKDSQIKKNDNFTKISSKIISKVDRSQEKSISF